MWRLLQKIDGGHICNHVGSESYENFCAQMEWRKQENQKVLTLWAVPCLISVGLQVIWMSLAEVVFMSEESTQRANDQCGTTIKTTPALASSKEGPPKKQRVLAWQR